MRRRGLSLGLPALALGAGSARGATPLADGLTWHEAAERTWGHTAWLRVAHADDEVALRALAAGRAALRRVERSMSLFMPDSALVELNRHGVLDSPPAELVAMLAAALGMARASGGAFDPTVQPLWRMRYEASLAGREPAARELEAARSRIDWRDVELDARRIRLARKGMALTLNGIAQGFAADLVRAAFVRHGVLRAWIDTGEWWPVGEGDGRGPWVLGVADPGAPATLLARLRADGRAIACSTERELAFTPDGRQHHILDPRTGGSPPALAAVVVLAPSATWADALSKPLFMSGAEQALALARRFGADALAVEKSGRWRASPGVPLIRG